MNAYSCLKPPVNKCPLYCFIDWIPALPGARWWHHGRGGMGRRRWDHWGSIYINSDQIRRNTLVKIIFFFKIKLTASWQYVTEVMQGADLLDMFNIIFLLTLYSGSTVACINVEDWTVLGSHSAPLQPAANSASPWMGCHCPAASRRSRELVGLSVGRIIIANV
jgi:hypothetical protein